MKKKLSLRKDTLVELGTDDLDRVAGGATPLCAYSRVIRCAGPSDFAMSLCRCLTQYCSIDVC